MTFPTKSIDTSVGVDMLALRLPASWGPGLYREAVAVIFRRLLHRYRSHQSYAQHI